MNLPLVRHNGVAEIAVHDFYSVKSPVFPFNKFRGVDTILGPEMRSTGEVMGVSKSYGQAFAKAQLAAGQRLPRKGTIFLSVNDRDKRHVGAARQGAARPRIPVARDARHGRGARSSGRRSRSRLQGERRPAQYRGPGEDRQGRSDHQYAAGPRIVLRREIDPARGDSLQHSVHHDACRPRMRRRAESARCSIREQKWRRCRICIAAHVAAPQPSQETDREFVRRISRAHDAVRWRTAPFRSAI